MKSTEILGNNGDFTLINNYDGDGNFQSMKRYDSQGGLADNFRYVYNSGTNRLNNVSGAADEYTYDNNGNATKDDPNHNFEIKYDYRNLMTESKNNLSQFTYWNKYFYDEAGNRIRKMVYLYDNSGIGGTDAGGSWTLTKDEFYVRDVSGKEIAVYVGSTLQQWNVFGLDNAGYLDVSNHKYFYLKDHLGSVHVVIDSTNTVVSAQDYDAWGYIMDGRSYAPENSMYKFTGKERDKDIENNYDYFGARYYNSRVANWTSIDPLFEKHIGWSPYNYVLRNPLILLDPNGEQTKNPEFDPLDNGGSESPENLGPMSNEESSVGENVTEPVREGSAKFELRIPEESLGKTWEVKLEKGSYKEMNLEGLKEMHGQEVTKESSKIMENSINKFMENTGAKPFDPPNTRITKIGGIRLFGKEVRIGPDTKLRSEQYWHIDFEQGGKGSSDVLNKVKVFTIPKVFQF